MKFEIYQAEDGFRWRLRARNGKIIADGAEAYKRASAALRMIMKITDIDHKKLRVILDKTK
jgi:uncharacterized protein YegP (UPF0339 family)